MAHVVLIIAPHALDEVLGCGGIMARHVEEGDAVHVLVPPDWSVQQGHDLVERIEADMRRALPPISVLTHLEPLGDPAAMTDIELHRAD